MDRRTTMTWWRLAGFGLLPMAFSSAFAQTTDTGWPTLTPTQTLEPTQQEMFPGPPGTPPVTLYFGASLAVRQGTALVGMPGYPGTDSDDEEGGPPAQGAVAIFLRQAGSWERTGTLRPTDAVANDFFGESVALGVDFAAVQAGSGIYVFRRTARGWQQAQKLTPPPQVQFNGGIAVGDRTVFAGAIMNGQPGAVFVFEPNLRGVWHVVQRLVSGEGAASDYFGGEVALADGTLVVGAAGDDDGQGAAFVFTRRPAGWSAPQKLIPADVQSGAAFGTAVAILPGRIAISAPEVDRQSGEDCFAGPSGAVYVFTPQHGLWRQQSKVPAPTAAAECAAAFGTTVAVGSNHVIGATPSYFPYQLGNAYVFQRDGQAYVPSAKAPDDSTVSTPILALADSALLVGLPYDRGFSTGMVEAFTIAGDESDDGSTDDRQHRGSMTAQDKCAWFRPAAAPPRARRTCSW